MSNAPSAAAGTINFATIANGNKPERAQAQLWINIGYVVVEQVDGKPVEKFVSLPLGIPVDTQEHLSTNSKNESFAKFQSARNMLLDQIMEVGKTLPAGESKILTVGPNGLSIQLRRVSGEAPEVPVEGNQFAKKMAF